MQLRRYTCKVKGNGELFGGGTSVKTYDYDWLLGKNRIGISPQPSTEAETFYGAFLAGSNTGLIIEREPRLLIQRRDTGFGKIVQGSGRAGEGEEISRLIELLTNPNGAHAFLTRERPEYTAHVLTFSRDPPSAELYKEIGPVPIES